MSSLRETMEKIKSLELEKQNLLAEIDSLKKLVNAKATKLENEIVALREEAKSLKTLVGQESIGVKETKIT